MGISTLIIVNTEARNVRFGHRWARWEAEVMRRLAPAELEIIDDPRDAEDTAKEAALAGYGRLVIVGDLATDAAFVNGLMALAESHLRGLKIGFLSLGRPNAWGRALGTPADVSRQLDVLSAANVLPYDVGKLECTGRGGRPSTRYFLSGAAIVPVQSGTRQRGPIEALVEDGGDAPRSGTWELAFAMLSPAYPGMGVIAPQANPSDGALDLAWVEGRGASALARSLMVSLLHLPRGLTHCTAQAAHLRCHPGPLDIHADGVPAGMLPATVTVVPRVLPVISEAIGSRLREKQRALLAEYGDAALAGNVKRLRGLERATHRGAAD